MEETTHRRLTYDGKKCVKVAISSKPAFAVSPLIVMFWILGRREADARSEHTFPHLLFDSHSFKHLETLSGFQI